MTPIRGFLTLFSSLKLTVVLLGLSLLLVFFGTLDQIHYGIHETQRRYFRSFFVIWYPLGPYSTSNWAALGFPLPAGYILGPLLFVNLLVAQITRFKLSWKKSGIFIIHTGLILLLISELITQITAEERQMWLDEGGTRNWAESYLENELVIIERTEPNLDTVFALDAEGLYGGKWIENEKLPVRIYVETFLPNASIRHIGPNESLRPQSTHGLAPDMGLFAEWRPKTYKENEVNTATALIHVYDGENKLGSWLVSNIFAEGDERFYPQTFTIDDTVYEVWLRFKRTYYPFSLTLHEFRHDRYPGTDIPKNFSSLVTVTDPELGVEREQLIYMNHPLRYEGHTFYQASFANQDTSSMLQVVRNPGWTLPYISVAMVGIGLTLQFCMSLYYSRFRRANR